MLNKACNLSFLWMIKNYFYGWISICPFEKNKNDCITDTLDLHSL